MSSLKIDDAKIGESLAILQNIFNKHISICFFGVKQESISQTNKMYK